MLVGALRRGAGLVDARHLRVAAAEVRVDLQVRVQLDGDNARRVKAPAKPVETGVAKAVIGKDRLPVFEIASIAGSDVAVGGSGPAQWRREQLAVLVQLLSRGHADFLAFVQAGQVNPRDTRQILAEVQHQGVFSHGPRGDHGPQPVLDHRREDHGAHPAAGRVGEGGFLKARKARLVPAHGGRVGVVHLAVENVVDCVRAAPAFPGFVRINPFRFAACVGEAQHG